MCYATFFNTLRALKGLNCNKYLTFWNSQFPCKHRVGKLENVRIALYSLYFIPVGAGTVSACTRKKKSKILFLYLRVFRREYSQGIWTYLFMYVHDTCMWVPMYIHEVTYICIIYVGNVCSTIYHTHMTYMHIQTDNN